MTTQHTHASIHLHHNATVEATIIGDVSNSKGDQFVTTLSVGGADWSLFGLSNADIYRLGKALTTLADELSENPERTTMTVTLDNRPAK